jgi:hypothetical protein
MDAMGGQAWKYMRRRPFPVFMKQIFNAALFCAGSDTLLVATTLRDLGDAEKRRLVRQRTQSNLKIPDVLFTGFVRFVTTLKWDVDEEALDEDDESASESGGGSEDRVTVSTTSFRDFTDPCYRGHGTLNVPASKVTSIGVLNHQINHNFSYNLGRRWT